MYTLTNGRAERTTRERKQPIMIRKSLGILLIVAAIINDIALTFAAASAAHISFWQYAMLNKFGLAVLVWGFNPGLMLLGVAAFILGFILYHAGQNAQPWGSREVTDWRTRV
jgi:hypothetical protein